MRVIGVGDNTVDKYLHLGKMFPGGNAVNVPVFANRLGHPSSYLGWIAEDPCGQLIYQSLKEEKINLSHCRLVKGKNAYCEISLKDNDRVFGSFSEGVCSQIELTEKDLEFISTHNLTHTSIYSFIEPFIKRLSEAAQLLSFDFSQEWDKKYLNRILPFVDFAILSSKEVALENNIPLMKWASTFGPRIILMTGGAEGALLFDGKTFFKQPIAKTTNPIDTLGAGDAFAAKFMVDYLRGIEIKAALANAAQFAAKTCTYHGAFGHGMQL